MNVKELVYADKEIRRAHREYCDGLIEADTFQRIRAERVAAIEAAVNAEPRGKIRARLVRVIMAHMRHDEDPQGAALLAWEDPAAEVAIPDEDERSRWAYGIVAFCETALRYR